MSELDDEFSQEEAAQLWRALIDDVTETPCRFPCLRDDLADWLRTRSTPQESDGREE